MNEIASLWPLFSSPGFMPHGHCFLWSPALVWGYVLSDSLIGASYYSIPIALWYFLKHRPDVPFSRVFGLFAAFIFACGTTHFIAIWNIWSPVYWLDAGIKMLTASVSVVTAVGLWPLLPKALALPSPRQLEIANQDLRAEVRRRTDAEAALQRLNMDLEERVAQRTAELESAYTSLKREMEERVRAERSLYQSEQSLAITLEGIGDAVVAVDLAGTISRMNSVAQTLTAWSLDDARSRPLNEVFQALDEATRTPVVDQVDTWLREGHGVRYSVSAILVARDGRERLISYRSAAIRDGDGLISGVVLVFRDCTEERAREVTRLRAIELEMENRQIQEGNRLKTEFLAHMSHEIRTPLNAILGFSQLIYDGRIRCDQPEHHEFMGDILNSGRHLLRLVNDMLDLSKVEAGKLTIHKERVDLRTLTAEVVHTLRSQASESAIRLTTEIDPRLAYATLDPGRFKQLLLNYLANALKFTPAGGSIVIRLLLEGDTGPLRVEVQDSGPGIAATDLGKLFVDFQQLDSDLTRKQQGTGLGLALTKKLVEAQGGEVGVTSQPGRGSTFYARLPLA